MGKLGIERYYEEQLHGTTAVSYTHLDVYKRQQQYHLMVVEELLVHHERLI